MKKTLIISIIVTIALTIFIPNISNANTSITGGGYQSSNSTSTGGSSSDNLGLGDLNSYRGQSGESQKLKSMAGNILGVIQVVGTILSVIILIILGLKYMTGSVEERADYKKTLIPYVIGAGILFTGSLLPQFIYNIVNQL